MKRTHSVKLFQSMKYLECQIYTESRWGVARLGRGMNENLIFSGYRAQFGKIKEISGDGSTTM
jgi:hypothetical protein